MADSGETGWDGRSGEFVAHLCFILDEEPSYSKFYKITCKSV